MRKLRVPPTSGALAGSVALTSLEVMPIRSADVFTEFQLASTAFTVTVKGASTAWALGAPDLPLAVPGADVSPGARICSLAKAPALTMTLLEVAFDKVPLVKLRVMVVATLCDKLVNVATPAIVLALRGPWS